MLKLTHKPKSQRNSGFTLIEILITIIVVSIGLLGLAGLQISGLRANMGSEERSKATFLASDIAERIRANPLGNYTNINMTENDCGAQPEDICSNYNSGTAADCTAAQMATFDVWAWACGMPVNTGVVPGGVTNVLTGGTGSVQCNDIDNGVDADACSPGSAHTITITWGAVDPNFSNNNVAYIPPQPYVLVMVP